ncbi:ribonuclease T2 [Trametes elegans]|nr:ribonuclease T2 [Trametes elegans]
MLTIPVVVACLAGLASAALDQYPMATKPHAFVDSITSACSSDVPASCQNTTPVADLCCFEAPGGMIVQTQLREVSPSLGPSNSWTIHGLRPDRPACDRTFSENCDPSRDYTDIGDLLQDQGAADTLSFMDKYWVGFNDENEDFWEVSRRSPQSAFPDSCALSDWHEWKTHGTCFSTLNPSCIASDSPKGSEAVAFFQSVVRLFKTLPTYDFLASAGITPSASKTYTHAAMTEALKAATGYAPALKCESHVKLSAVEYYFNLKGSVIDGEFIPIDLPYTVTISLDAPDQGSCASSGIKYSPKAGGSITTTSLPSKGTIHSSMTGGLLFGGKWSTQALATYHFSRMIHTFTMSTSKGECGISDEQLACGDSVGTLAFSAVTSSGSMLISFSGTTESSSDKIPSGSAQETVFADGDHSMQYILSNFAS